MKMALLYGSLSRNGRLSSLFTHLARNFQVCKEARCPARKTWPGSFHTILPRLRGDAAGACFLQRSSGRTVSLHLRPSSPVPGQCGRRLHSSPPLRALPAPLLWMVLKPLQKIVAILLGRSLRKWWVGLPVNRRQLIREWVRRRRWPLAAGAGVVMVMVALLLLTHLDESPVTGRLRLLVFGRDKYLELATLTSEAYMEEFGEHLLPESDPLHQMVKQLVQLLAQRNKDIPEVAEITWTVHIVNKPTINAFVLPDGKVFMFTGMLEAVADIDQLIIVLGHEMAHAILEHSAEQASLSHVVDLLSLILVTAIWAMCPGDSLAVLGSWAKDKLTELMFSRPYSRKLEAEADQVGLQLAAKACADVRVGPVFWQQLELVDKLAGEPTMPEWLSTHPSHRNRSSQMERLIPQALELRESCSCPALPPTDPRVVFSETVRVMLEKVKDQPGVEQERAAKPRPSAVPVTSPAALVAQTVLPSISNVSQPSKREVSAEAPGTPIAAPVPAAPEKEGSQHAPPNTRQQGS